MKTEVIKNRFPLFSTEFIKAYTITMRPYLMFVSGITGIAGFSFGKETNPLALILLFSAAFLSYGFGQALTDCFQIDTDSISSPYRPLTQGLVSQSEILSISIAGLIYCVLVFSFFNPVNFILGLISGIGLATYTPFKRKWWGGPFYNAWIVGVLFVIAYLSVTVGTKLLLSNKIILTLSCVFFGYTNFVLSGYFKDITADRATGYKTLPVVFGRKVSAITSDIFALFTIISSSAVVLLILKNNYSSYSTISVFLLIAGILTSITAQVRLHFVKTDEESYRSISLVVNSYILILSGVAAANKPGWSILLIAYYLCYMLVIKIRPAKNQI